jgi:hypothetical protein
LASWIQKCLKWASRGFLWAIWPTECRNAQNDLQETFGVRFGQLSLEMFEISLQSHPESDLASWAQKYWKWASRGLLRAIWPADRRNGSNDSKKLSEIDFASWAQKCLKWACKAILRAIWPADPRNAENEFPEAYWDRIGQPSSEMLEISLQSHPESDLDSWAQKCWKWLSRGLLRVNWPAEPRNAWNEFPKAYWEWFGQPTPEMLEMSLQRHPVSDLTSWSQKWFKWL